MRYDQTPPNPLQPTTAGEREWTRDFVLKLGLHDGLVIDVNKIVDAHNAAIADERENTKAYRDLWHGKHVEIHPATRDLVIRFSRAVLEKLAAAEKKYGYTDKWANTDWMDECKQHLVEHIEKGDPRDVAAFCAFLWHHGESTSACLKQLRSQLAALTDALNEIATVAEDYEGAVIKEIAKKALAGAKDRK